MDMDLSPSPPSSYEDIPSSPDHLALDAPRASTLPDTLSPGQASKPVQGKKRARTASPTPSVTSEDYPPQAFAFRANTATPQAKDPRTIQEGLQMMLTILVKTLPLAKPSSSEQNNLLQLQDNIRDYSATGSIVNKANAMLASHLADCNKATKELSKVCRTLGSQAQQLTTKTASQRAATPAQGPPPSPAKTPSKPATYAAMASKGLPPTQGWQTATYKKTSPKPPSKSPLKDRQIVLLREVSTPIDSLALRNAFNQAFKDRGVDKPAVSSVQLSNKGNIVVTGMPDFPAKFLLEKKAAWQSLLTFTKAIPCRSWCKVAVHGLPTNISLDLLPQEIKTFNKGLKPVGRPYWLSSQEKRASKSAGSACIAFETEEDALTAIKDRLFAFGISLRVEKLHSCSPTTQCTNCQQFGHAADRCRNKVACSICSRNHPTANHRCNHCPAKGRKCIHSTLQCANCKQAHTSDDSQCEALQALQSPPTSTPSSDFSMDTEC